MDCSDVPVQLQYIVDDHLGDATVALCPQNVTSDEIAAGANAPGAPTCEWRHGNIPESQGEGQGQGQEDPNVALCHHNVTFAKIGAAASPLGVRSPASKGAGSSGVGVTPTKGFDVLSGPGSEHIYR